MIWICGKEMTKEDKKNKFSLQGLETWNVGRRWCVQQALVLVAPLRSIICVWDDPWRPAALRQAPPERRTRNHWGRLGGSMQTFKGWLRRETELGGLGQGLDHGFLHRAVWTATASPKAGVMLARLTPAAWGCVDDSIRLCHLNFKCRGSLQL